MSGAHQRERDRPEAPGRSGPRTAAGKGRSARNAFRHGLRLSVLADPVAAAEVEALAGRIAQGVAHADDEITAVARRVAQAQVDIARIRRVRHELLAAALGRPGGGPRPAEPRLATRPSQRLDQVSEQISGPPTNLASRLATIDRYQRRALSRRKFAIRHFDAVSGIQPMKKGQNGTNEPEIRQ